MTTDAENKVSAEIARVQEMISSAPMRRMRQKALASGARVTPKNAATIILLRGEPGREELVMGRRNRNLKFMPGAMVFPGGRVDRGDWRVPAADPLRPEVRAKLLENLRGRPGEASAHALGIAALRELHEETGHLIGRKSSMLSAHPDWKAYAEHGLAPSLDSLRLLGRAITPSGVHRRFDTWFFVTRLNAYHVQPEGGFTPSGELEELKWLTPEAAMSADTREITRVILVELMNRLRDDPNLDPAWPAPCYSTIRDRFHRRLM
ncbi:MAG: NUDIX domain-containing protein [Phyllobacteriaceae bacterium]|nr:NUDIX domain-containing protein [Phyllobacteriaceae bacterium]